MSDRAPDSIIEEELLSLIEFIERCYFYLEGADKKNESWEKARRGRVFVDRLRAAADARQEGGP